MGEQSNEQISIDHPRPSTYPLAKSLRILADSIAKDDETARIVMLDAAKRLIELRELLEKCEPMVYATHAAEHMLDGFQKRHRPDIDGLCEAVRKEMSN